MDNVNQSPKFPFAIGCPVWSSDRWGEVVYPNQTARRDWLSWYTRMFNTADGNSTFYALPTPDVAKRLASESAEGFRFALKFPRDLSHEDAFAPAFARRMADAFRNRFCLKYPPLPSPPVSAKQMTLFDE